MSKGLGAIERAVVSIFTEQPSHAHSTAALCDLVYGKQANYQEPEKRHRVSILRACRRLRDRYRKTRSGLPLDYTEDTREFGNDGRVLQRVYEYSPRSERLWFRPDNLEAHRRAIDSRPEVAERSYQEWLWIDDCVRRGDEQGLQQLRVHCSSWRVSRWTE